MDVARERRRAAVCVVRASDTKVCVCVCVCVCAASREQESSGCREATMNATEDRCAVHLLLTKMLNSKHKTVKNVEVNTFRKC